ncbi:hypothetical protein DYB35_003693 [Aphanomyces astaci]|uniref:Uncharacterized protein n=2 Tax=Aphanomyces astaci TaxID=112090 RepID=A0A3R6XWV0_APHAT|nr:hypothetical protein DYB35_003693 [Aphanomyces astaci]
MAVSLPRQFAIYAPLTSSSTCPTNHSICVPTSAYVPTLTRLSSGDINLTIALLDSDVVADTALTFTLSSSTFVHGPSCSPMGTCNDSMWTISSPSSPFVVTFVVTNATGSFNVTRTPTILASMNLAAAAILPASNMEFSPTVSFETDPTCMRLSMYLPRTLSALSLCLSLDQDMCRPHNDLSQCVPVVFLESPRAADLVEPQTLWTVVSLVLYTFAFVVACLLVRLHGLSFVKTSMFHDLALVSLLLVLLTSLLVHVLWLTTLHRLTGDARGTSGIEAGFLVAIVEGLRQTLLWVFVVSAGVHWTALSTPGLRRIHMKSGRVVGVWVLVIITHFVVLLLYVVQNYSVLKCTYVDYLRNSAQTSIDRTTSTTSTIATLNSTTQQLWLPLLQPADWKYGVDKVCVDRTGGAFVLTFVPLHLLPLVVLVGLVVVGCTLHHFLTLYLYATSQHLPPVMWLVVGEYLPMLAPTLGYLVLQWTSTGGGGMLLDTRLSQMIMPSTNQEQDASEQYRIPHDTNNHDDNVITSLKTTSVAMAHVAVTTSSMGQTVCDKVVHLSHLVDDPGWSTTVHTSNDELVTIPWYPDARIRCIVTTVSHMSAVESVFELGSLRQASHHVVTSETTCDTVTISLVRVDKTVTKPVSSLTDLSVDSVAQVLRELPWPTAVAVQYVATCVLPTVSVLADRAAADLAAAFLPCNLHVQDLHVRDARGHAAAVYSTLTMGIFASHHPTLADTDGHPQHATEGHETTWHAHARATWVRETETNGQALATVVTAVVDQLNTQTQAASRWMEWVATKSVVFHMESLVSDHGKERQMLRDCAAAMEWLQLHVTLGLELEEEESNVDVVNQRDVVTSVNLVVQASDPSHMYMCPDIADVVRMKLAALTQSILQAKRERVKKKHPEILQVAAHITRLIGGAARVTACASGNDRTAMSVTLEHGWILGHFHHVPAPGVRRAVAAMRSEGVCLDVIEKNRGTRQYSFSSLQRSMLPEAYRCPEGTYDSSATGCC